MKALAHGIHSCLAVKAEPSANRILNHHFVKPAADFVCESRTQIGTFESNKLDASGVAALILVKAECESAGLGELILVNQNPFT